MSSIGKDVSLFVAACDNLLEPECKPQQLNAAQHQIIQYYLAAMIAKFPAVQTN